MKAMIRTTLALFALAVVGSAPLAAQQAGIVYLDSERLRQEAPSLQEARQKMQAEMAQLEAQADSAMAPLGQELQQMAVQFQQQQGMMTPETRQQQQTAIQQKQAQLQQTRSEWEQRAAQRQNEILAPALTHINEVIDQLRQEKGYSFILDAAAGGVVAADPALDITSEVLARLNSSAQGS